MVSGGNVHGVIARDLKAEADALDTLVAELDPDDWRVVTPAPGWTSLHQIAHLAFFDSAAEMSLTDPDCFAEHRKRADEDPEVYGASALEPLLAMSPGALLSHWRQARRSLQKAFAEAPTDARYPWFGPPMSLASMATARLMETWAHGQDIADTFGIARSASPRLTHVARIACLALPYAFANRGIPIPETAVRVELTTDGELWTFGDAGASERVSGSVDDFCLVLTRRRHVSDTRLRVEGQVAEQWMLVGQAYAGPPGLGRQPGQFAVAR